MAPSILPARRVFAVLALSTTLLASCAPIETTPTPAGVGLPGLPGMPGAPPIATGDLSAYPATYAATSGGVVYTGWPAQVLNHLFAVVPGHATTYATHNTTGGGLSADLWTEGAGYGANNSGMASMDQLAEYIAANRDALGIRYVIWQQHVNYGQGWTLQRDQGNLTKNHMDHIHITFQDGAPITLLVNWGAV